MEPERIALTIHRARSRQRLSVKLFGKLLLARDHVQRGTRNSRELQPIAPLDHFERLHHSITDPYVQAKPNEYATVEARFDREPRASIRGSMVEGVAVISADERILFTNEALSKSSSLIRVVVKGGPW